MSVSLITADQVERIASVEAVSTVSTTNITLSGLQNLNGATGVAGDRVFVSGQTAPAEDGVYFMQVGAWDRAYDSIAGDDFGSTFFIVEDGTFAGQIWQVTAKRGAGVVGTDALPIQEHTGAASTLTEVYGEELGFAANTFTATLANIPVTVKGIYKNGQRLDEGGSDDYTISGLTITVFKQLKANDKLLGDYTH